MIDITLSQEQLLHEARGFIIHLCVILWVHLSPSHTNSAATKLANHAVDTKAYGETKAANGSKILIQIWMKMTSSSGNTSENMLAWLALGSYHVYGIAEHEHPLPEC